MAMRKYVVDPILYNELVSYDGLCYIQYRHFTLASLYNSITNGKVFVINNIHHKGGDHMTDQYPDDYTDDYPDDEPDDEPYYDPNEPDDPSEDPDYIQSQAEDSDSSSWG